MDEKRQKRRIIYMIVKYAFAFLFSLLTIKTTKQIGFAIPGILETLAVIFLTDLLIRVDKRLGCLGSFLGLLINAQNIVLFFSGSYVTYVMLQSIYSIQDLAGKAILYGGAAVAGIVLSFLPVTELPIKTKFSALGVALALALDIGFITISGVGFSPIGGVYGIYDQWSTHQSMYTENDEFDESKLQEFYRDRQNLDEENVEPDTENEAVEVMVVAETNDNTEEPKEQGEQPILEGYTESGTISGYACGLSNPNVILIFSEGLSQNVIDDERQIMPNVKSLQQQSISFQNYYNHTFATYRGLSGQLYSGYQLDDYDPNYLISLENIMHDQGYFTSFINTEPNNPLFTSYVYDFGFDEVISDPARCNGAVSSMNDAEAYDFLFETALHYDAEKTQPFFLTIYTFGTHTTFDSVDGNVVFGDGSNRVLNRFFYADIQIGRFLENFKNSSLASDTVIVFTADHCTYADSDFCEAFPEYGRACTDVDRIPLYFYYVGGPVASVNAYGRNSLDMAPTVLDFLNISAPNYFLGESLFSEKKGDLCLDMIFYDPAYLKITDGGKVRSLDDATADYIYGHIREYFAVKSQKLN